LLSSSIAAIGWVLFGGMAVTTLSILGLLTSFVGAFAYSYISVTKQMEAQALKARGGAAKPATGVPAPVVDESSVVVKGDGIAIGDAGSGSRERALVLPVAEVSGDQGGVAQQRQRQNPGHAEVQ
jgi:hypothetical protein